MKKLLVFLLCIICFVTLSSCSHDTQQGDGELLSIELETPEDIKVEKGTIYKPEGITVKAVFENKVKNVTLQAEFVIPNTNELGKKEVIVNYQSKSASYEIEIVPGVPTITYSLRVQSEPKKTEYFEGEPLDLEGLEIVMLKNEKEPTKIPLEQLDMVISVNGHTATDLSESGNYRISFSMRHLENLYTTYISITVLKNINQTQKDKLMIDEKESKLVYWLNEVFDPSTIVVYITDESGTHQSKIPNDRCKFTLLYHSIVLEDYKFRNEGPYILRVEFENIIGEAEIIVKFRHIEKKLVLDLTDHKVHYTVGETFTSTGLVIWLYEDDVKTRMILPQYCEFTLYKGGFEKPDLILREPGTYSVKVEYKPENISEGYKIAVV